MISECDMCDVFKNWEAIFVSCFAGLGVLQLVFHLLWPFKMGIKNTDNLYLKTLHISEGRILKLGIRFLNTGTRRTVAVIIVGQVKFLCAGHIFQIFVPVLELYFKKYSEVQRMTCTTL